MLRAEAIKILKAAETDHFPYEPKKLVEAFELAIASLETDEAYQLEYEKPTTKNDLGVDCISRADVNRIICEYRDDATETGNERDLERAYGANAVGELISELPSVTPQEPKTGHWIEEFNDLEGEVRFTCSSCGKYQLFGTDFCYHCGAKMVESQETEDTT